MYKRKSFILLVFVLAFSAVFAAANSMLPFNASRGSVKATSEFDYVVSRFDRVGLDGDGRYPISSNTAENQYLSLKSRFFSSTGGVEGTLLEKPAVFSTAEMEDIVKNGVSKVYKTPEQNDAGFVILDNDNNIDLGGGNVTYSNYVVFELQNVTAIPTLEKLKHNGNDIGRNSDGTQDFGSSEMLNMALSNVGKVCYNSNYLCAVFKDAGYYEFDLSVIAKGYSAEMTVRLKFGFFIASIDDYSEDDMPVFEEPLSQGLTKNGNNFYYNYQGEAPEITFTKDRFDVSVAFKDYNDVPSNKGVQYTDNAAAGQRTHIFNKVGTYTVSAQMTFPYNGSVVKVPTTRYLLHTYNLDIFGYQAYYEDYSKSPGEDEDLQSWFGTTGDTNSDITMTGGYNIVPAHRENNAAIQELVNVIAARQIKPVVTNMPPVYLRGISKLAYADPENKTGLYSRVAYRQTAVSAWQYDEYSISKPFSKAGEYAVILYYKYAAAGNENLIYGQAFYFKINDLCVNVTLHVDGEAYSFSDFIGKKIYASITDEADEDFAFYLYNPDVGSYERKPVFDLFFVSAVDSSENRLIEDYDLLEHRLEGFGDGVYKFSVYFGNNSERVHMPSMDFSVVLDSTPLGGFKCTSTGKEMEGVAAENVSVFGPGEVRLSWNAKANGVEMKMAELDFYEIKKSPNNSLAGSNTGSQNLGSSHSLKVLEERNLRIESVIINGKVTGYRLADKLAAPGLYVVTITDAAGNKAVYTIIIDDSLPRFAQNSDISSGTINVQKTGAIVGFGNYKLVSGVTLGDNVPKIAGLITSGGILIPITSKQKSTDGVNFETIESGKLSETLTTEGMYFYKITDALGNTGTHYIQINNDATQQILLEDTVPTIHDNGNIVSDSASIIANGGISNRDYLTYSFMQASNSTVSNYVKTVKIAYYELTFNTLKADGVSPNSNYPFSDVASIAEINIPYDCPKNQRIFIDINRTPKTRQGLYVISRICYSAPVANFYFIVDNNPVISGKNFESGIQVTFGSGADKKTAAYKDFQKDIARYVGEDGKLLSGNHKVLQGNSAAAVNAPAARADANSAIPNIVPGGTVTSGANYNEGTKYGNAVFNVVTGDFSESSKKNVAFTSLKLTQETLKRDTKTSIFNKTTGGMTTSGMYAVSFRDGSGGWPLVLGGSSTASDGNRSEILVELYIDQPQGAFFLNGKQISESAWQPNNPSNPTKQVMSSVKAVSGDTLRFSFSNDSANFLQTIAVNGNYAPVVKRNGVALNRATVPMTESTMGSLTVYEFNLPMTNVTSDDTFSIQLNTTGGSMSVVYTLVIDTTRPSANLDRIMNTSSDGDRWFVNIKYFEHRQNVLAKAGGDLDNNTTNPLKYPFRISNSFVFRTADPASSTAKGNPYFDTRRISYYEVTSKLGNITGEYAFDYADVNMNPQNENEMSFYDRVGMKSTENRFFRIVEYDEVGNRAEYFVELRGDDYVDTISVNGITEYAGNMPTGNIITGSLINKVGNSYAAVHGIELTVQDVSDFFNNNLFFEITCGYQTIKRLGLDSLTLDSFKEQLQIMLDSTRDKSATITIDNRFAVYQISIRHINRSFGQLFVGNASEFGNQAYVTVTIGGMGAFDDGNYFFEVYDYTNNTTLVRKELKFNNSSILLDDVNNDYLITVYDEFGRVKRFAFNGLYGSNISLQDGGVSLDGELYYGSDGATVDYIASAYEFSLYKDGELVYRNGEAVAGFDLSKIITTTWDREKDLRTVRILPEPNSKTNWKIVALRRGTSERWEREFNFYTILPEIRFSNISGDDWTERLTAGDQDANGIVVVKYSNVGLLFSANASYTRTFDGKTTFTPIGAYMPTFNLLYSGDYVVEIINELGARAVYNFTIADASNRNYKVFFKDTEIFASPQQYNNAGKYIPSYFVNASNAGDVMSKLNVVATDNTKLTVSNPVVSGASTLIYEISGTTGVKFSFAVTFIPNNLGSVGINIASSTNGNNWNKIEETGSNPKYSFWYQNGLATGYLKVNLSITSEYSSSGNYVYADYYRNGGRDDGEYCGTLVGKQELIINAKDYGYYTFYVYDHAGNQRKFGAGNDVDHYTLVNLGRGPLMVNNIIDKKLRYDAIIDDMVYNDSVTLSVMEIPNQQVLGANYPYAKSLTVSKNNVQYLSYTKKPDSVTNPSFVLNEPGFYRIDFVYQIGPSLSVQSYHSFTIVSSSAGQQNFSFNAGSNMEITGLKFENSDIRKDYAEIVLKNIFFDSSTGYGTYNVTVQIGADNIYTYARTREFTIYIKNMPGVGVSSNITFGTSTTDKVNISMISGSIYDGYGESDLVICRDGKEVRRIEIKGDEIDYTQYVVATLSASGRYQIYLVSAGATVSGGIVSDGEVYFAEGFVINEAMNFLTIVFIVIILGVVALGIFLFIKMRVGLRVR